MRHHAFPAPPKVALLAQALRLDAAESLFLERELEHKLAMARDVKYALTEARRFIPTSNEADPGAGTIVYERGDYAGSAKIIKNYSDDLPRVNANTTEERQAIKTLGAAFGYSIDEVKAAAKAKRPLTDRLVIAVRRTLEEKVDRIAALGDSDAGLPGFARRSDTLTQSITADGTGSSKKWTAKTADKIVRDFNLIVAKMITETKQVEKPDSVLLPTDAHAHIASTPRSDTSDTTILEFLLRNNPWIRSIEPWPRLDLAGGSSDTTRAIAYRRSPEVLELHIPEEFSMLPPQPKNLAFDVMCTLKTAGVIVYYPKAIVYADGI